MGPARTCFADCEKITQSLVGFSNRSMTAPFSAGGTELALQAHAGFLACIAHHRAMGNTEPA